MRAGAILARWTLRGVPWEDTAMDVYRVTYARRDELQRDLDTQIARGGLYVLAPPPGELTYGAKCGLEIVAPDGRAVSLVGEVLTVMPGHGLALAIDASSVEAVRAIAAARKRVLG